MRLVDAVAPNLAGVLRRDFWWMLWNTLLAWVPVGLALVLFRRPRSVSRSPMWWLGLALFVLFLPNAPYVVTDLIHLRDDVVYVKHSWPVITAVLPVYVAFIGSGFLAYYLALSELGRYLGRMGLEAWRGLTLTGVHALCAVGVYLGRSQITRLNSWEPVVEPRDTLDRIVLGLSWRYAPFLILATFAVTWIGYFVTKAVVEAAWETGLRLNQRRKNWTFGPMLKAKANVPRPTDPPSSHPAVSAPNSRLVRTMRMDPAPRPAKPVIKPSRGPGPNPAPI